MIDKSLGQYFTPQSIAKKMITLIQNQGTILEPSCGNGVFLSLLPENTKGIEIDPQYKFSNVENKDFFTETNTYDTIIGNPPYIRYKDIPEKTKQILPKVMNQSTNLYCFFIWQCIDLLNDNGELIFIVPRDFVKLTSAKDLNNRLYNEGGFTYWEEFGDEKIFSDASPNVVIFRWVKNKKHTININNTNGLLSFSDTANRSLIGDLFTIQVGGASGANKVFIHPQGNIDLVVSTTKKTGQTKKAFYVTEPNDYLLQHKDTLLNRKIKKFNENNWWEWGRKIRKIEGEKIYVNNKTRDLQPFFTNNSGFYDGSILALIPKQDLNIQEYIDILNNNDWEQQGFLVGGRLIFGQRSLSNAFV